MQITVGCDHTITAEKSTALAVAAAIMCSAMAQHASETAGYRDILKGAKSEPVGGFEIVDNNDANRGTPPHRTPAGRDPGSRYRYSRLIGADGRAPSKG